MVNVAVVTPYHRESDRTLLQCHHSVLGQTHSCHHVVVADGHPRPFLDDSPRTLHIKLPVSNDDNGNTPRALGAILAEAQGFEAIAFLDADNWYNDDHIAGMVAAHRRTGHPLVACKRHFHDVEGRPMPIHEIEEEAQRHVDTSCWLILRPAFHLLRAWLMPRPLGPVCDRVFLRRVLHEGLAIATSECRGVHFRTRYAPHYQAIGLPLPSDVKDTRDVVHRANAFLDSAEGAAFERTLGFALGRFS